MGDQQSFTEQWVNQVQTNPAMLSPPHQPPMASPPHVDQTMASPELKSKTPLSSPMKENEENLSPHKDQITFQNGQLPENAEEEEDEEENEYDLEYPREKAGNEDDMQEDETIEEFEDRVLNKRASQLHRILSRKFADNFTVLSRKNTRRQAAQKFHSMLVLQKMTVIDMTQASEPPYGEIVLSKGPAFSLKGKGK